MPNETMDDDSLYSEPTSSGSEGDTETVDQEEAAGNTAVISNKVLSPDGESLAEGDEIVLRVVKNFGDESEVEYAPKGEGRRRMGQSETSPAMAGGSDYESELSALDQKE